MKKKHSKDSAKEQQEKAQKTYGNTSGNRRIMKERVNPETGFSEEFNRLDWIGSDDELFTDPGI